jgi:hypothetical protein
MTSYSVHDDSIVTFMGVAGFQEPERDVSLAGPLIVTNRDVCFRSRFLNLTALRHPLRHLVFLYMYVVGSTFYEIKST